MNYRKPDGAFEGIPELQGKRGKPGKGAKILPSGGKLTWWEYDDVIDDYVDTGVVVSGSSSDEAVTFPDVDVRENIQSGWILARILGTIKKWLSDLGSLAFKNTVSWASDISDKPTWIGSTKPSYNYSEIGGAPDLSLKADLVSGKVPAAQLPSYVDDVIEGTLHDVDEFRDVQNNVIAPETGKIYVDVATGKSYRWGGSLYAELSKSIGLGETASTAFPGDRGKALEENKANKSIRKTTVLFSSNWLDISGESEIEGVNVEGFNFVYPLFDSDFTIESEIVFVPASNQERLKGREVNLHEYAEIVSGEGEVAMLIFADLLPTQDINVKLNIEK